MHIICKRSSFFESACSDRWMKERKPIELVDDKPDTFSAYLKLVYEGELRSSLPQNEYLELVRLYVLADRSRDLRAANAVIDGIIRYSDTTWSLPPKSAIRLAMNSTPPKSALQRLVRDYCVQEAGPQWIVDPEKPDDGEELPRSFLVAVAEEFMTRRRQANYGERVADTYSRRIKEMPRCHYHQHDDSCPPCKSAATAK